MPYNGDIYSPPAGSKGAPKTTIQSSKYNTFLDDITDAQNFKRPLTAGGTGATNATDARANLNAVGLVGNENIAGLKKFTIGIVQIGDDGGTRVQYRFDGAISYDGGVTWRSIHNAIQLDGQLASYYTNIPARLGYTPVQQGTGVGQFGNAVKIGYSAIGLKYTVDNTDFGRFWTDNNTPASFSSSGYQKLPSGLVMQWGSSVASISGELGVINFPTAFSAPPASVVVSNGDAINNAQGAIFGVASQNTTSFVFRTTGYNGLARVNWLAMGN